ncbi:hypothetical protein NE237_006136 [Protea cynaroides]|uniref:mitogen-activated protein kinase kinase n=1 Tax=Protea cynaroides TaxID=273540 RepID=A0A9Q0KLX5_9MAGN|nr:hypothetical protein NE237_006136 [Protea cynaroides]
MTTVIPIHSYLKKLKVLGHGNGGTIYQVRYKRTSVIYAHKVVNGDCDTTIRIFYEMKILHHMDSPFIIKCHEIFEKPSGDISILMEYMDASSLDTLPKSHGILLELSLSPIACQVLHGLNYLHFQKIVHGDIKPANLLVNQNMEVCMSRTLEHCHSYVGTCAYMSLEGLKLSPIIGGSNRPSSGLTIMELYVGHFPLLCLAQKPEWATLMCAICLEEPPSLLESASEQFSELH